MRNITQEQASAVIAEMYAHVRTTQDLATNPTEVNLYHTLPHTVKVGSVACAFAKGFGLDITDAWAAQIAASGHDADLLSTVHEDPLSPHEAFRLKRVRDISGVAEDISAMRVADACARVGITQADRADIVAADKATTVQFDGSNIRQPRLLESGNSVLNFLVAKSDIAHIIPLRDPKEKQDIVLRLWLEMYPLATTQLLNGTFVAGEEHYDWLKQNLGYFLEEVQRQFAKSQYIQLFEDAEMCSLPARAMHYLNQQYSPVVQRKHLDTMHRIAETVVASPHSVVSALYGATEWLRYARKTKLTS